MARKQRELTGMEAQSIPAIEEAASAYVAVRDKRMRLTEQEVAAKLKLISVMIEHQKDLTVNGHGERIYCYEDEMVVLTKGKEGVKVKAMPEGDAEDPEDDD